MRRQHVAERHWRRMEYQHLFSIRLQWRNGPRKIIGWRGFWLRWCELDCAVRPDGPRRRVKP